MPTTHRKIGRRNRPAPGPLENKTISVSSQTAAAMQYHRVRNAVNWSAECERMILEYINELEKGD